VAAARVAPNTVSAQPLLTGVFYGLSFVSGAFIDVDLGRVGDGVVRVLPPTLVVAVSDSARRSMTDGAAELAALWLWGALGLVAARSSSRHWIPRVPKG
jgi:hypothetical protein